MGAKKTRKLKSTTPRALASRHHGIETRKRILSSTLKILERDGYSALNTNHISEEADIRPASLYRLFPNKESILWVLTEAWHTSIIEGYNACTDRYRSSLNLRELLAKCYMVTLENDYSQHPAYMEIYRAASLIPELNGKFVEHATNICRIIADTIDSYGHSIPRQERSELATFIFSISVDSLNQVSSAKGIKRKRLIDWSLRLLDFTIIEFIEKDHPPGKLPERK